MAKQQPPKNRMSVLAGVIVLAIVTIVGLTVVSAVAMQQSKNSLKNNPDKTTVVNLVGEGVCLPKKDADGPQTLECTYGIKVADGTYYALDNLDNHDGSEPIKAGSTISVSGDLVPPSNDEIYDIAGTIEVRSVKLK